MSLSVLFLTLVMLGRITLLGYERIQFKKAGQNQDALVSTFLLFAIAGVMLLPMIFFASFEAINGLLNALVSGTVYSIAFVLYVHVLSHYEASLVSPFYNFNAFFLLILSMIFLGENFTWFKLVGVLFLFIGTFFLDRKQRTNFKENITALFTNRGCLLMILVSFLVAIGRIIDGLFVKTTTDPFLYAIIQYCTISLYLFGIILVTRRIRLIASIFASHYKNFLLGSFANAYSYILLLVSIALLHLELSIAEPLSMLSLLVTMVLSVWLLREEIKGRIVGALLMIAGGIFLVL